MASMPKEQNSNSELLNSSFYSSNSINTLDHAKNFRNSLILRDMSDQSVDVALRSGDVDDRDGIAAEKKAQQQIMNEDETVTMKMSTSPSLSALANILNEKSKQAQQNNNKTKEIVEPLMEEDESPIETKAHSEGDTVMSPNLIDVNDDDNLQFPRITPQLDSTISEQPDFLSSPTKEQGSFQAVEITTTKQDPLPTLTQDSEIKENLPTSTRHIDHDISTEKPKKESQKIESRQAKSINNSNSTVVKKKRNIFSFLKRKSSTESALRETAHIRKSVEEIPNSTSFSAGTVVSGISPATKITKKSYSSSNIFSTFKKNKDYKKESGHRSRSQSTTTIFNPKQNERPKDTPDIGANAKIQMNKTSSSSTNPMQRLRKPTPLNVDRILENEQSAIAEVPKFETIPSENNTDSPLLDDPRLDTGEVLFPKSLSKHEVDSIVSLERSRSTKSNKRSSIASHRRSLTDTLSINAQNEGMFVTEASSIVISTPDLTKSPTGSILRNGKFESLDLASSSSIMHDDMVTTSPMEHLDIGGGLGLSPDINSFSLDSIGEKFREMTLVTEQETQSMKGEELEARKKKFEEDPELMSDIMEFASLINFGDGINLDVEETETPYKAMRPTSTYSVPSFDELPEQDSMHLSQSQLGSEIAEVSLSFDDGFTASSPERISSKPTDLNTFDDFENENFNEIEITTGNTPQLKQSVNDSQMARPISLSFRGLKAPAFAAFQVDSPISKTNTDDWPISTDYRRCVNFSSQIVLYDTYAEDEYDRKPDIATCNQLTPQLAQLIKAELNELKCDMEIHEESKCYTHFY